MRLRQYAAEKRTAGILAVFSVIALLIACFGLFGMSMLMFYQKWLNSSNLRESFVAAKKELRIDYPEPIYWGAFMMIGLD